jgi:cytochrome c peroxidase
MRPTLLAAGLLAGAAVAQIPPGQRKPPRPEKAAAEYAAQAADLRAAYSKPPAEWPKPTLDPGVEHRELGPLPAVTHPADNPHSKAKADLGKALFFDPRLSGGGQLACASCHDPDLGWADGRSASFGHARTPLRRNAPSVLNSGFHPALYWDGRAKSLEDQARQVLGNPNEMRFEEAAAVKALKAAPGYPDAFAAAFGDPVVTGDRVVQALACFERTVVGGRSRFDAFLKGKADALSDGEVRGLHLFRTDARCLNCHSGPALSDGKFHDIGLSQYGRPGADLGRHAVTKDPKDVGAFRTPMLRNVGKTAPYMHNGAFDLAEVLRLYNSGMPVPRRTEKFKDDLLFPANKSKLVQPLGLNATDLADLEAFLRTLDEPHRLVRPPKLSLPPGATDTRGGP